MKLRLVLATDNHGMRSLIHRLRQLPPQTIGLLAAVITVSIWSAFIVIARASASGHLLPLDIAWARMVGAGLVLGTPTPTPPPFKNDVINAVLRIRMLRSMYY
jgi:hypothetical protein